MTLHHPLVRDLAWAINSPNLYPLPGMGHWQDDSQWFAELLARLDQEPGPLVDYLAQAPQRRLGRYFEQLWQFYFAQHLGFELLAHNLQIADAQGKTRGELDLVVRHKGLGEIWHLELAVKFFLRVQPGTDIRPLNAWVGPNLADRLDLKYQKTLNEQLPLSQSGRSRLWLAAQGLTVDKSLALFKGRLFVPGLCQAGWLTQSQWLSLPEDRLYLGLERRQWLAELGPEASWQTKDALAQVLVDQPSPTQVAVFNPALGKETGRLFICPDGWPQQAAMFSAQGAKPGEPPLNLPL